jgi:hypothetical protein
MSFRQKKMTLSGSIMYRGRSSTWLLTSPHPLLRKAMDVPRQLSMPIRCSSSQTSWTSDRVSSGLSVAPVSRQQTRAGEVEAGARLAEGAADRQATDLESDLGSPRRATRLTAPAYNATARQTALSGGSQSGPRIELISHQPH